MPDLGALNPKPNACYKLEVPILSLSTSNLIFIAPGSLILGIFTFTRIPSRQAH